MVRLKGFTPGGVISPESLFQFQYGAIEGSRWEWHTVSPLLFQFQYGAIEGAPKIIDGYWYEISIPVWCDWRNDCAVSKLATNLISIPVWCDWRFNSLSTCTSLFSRFQFQYGAIEGSPTARGSLSRIHISIPVWCDWRSRATWTPPASFCNFNSSMVRLKVTGVTVLPRPAYRISIPVWCDWRLTLFFSFFVFILFQFQYGAIEGTG